MFVVMKTAGDPAGYAPVARAAVFELDPNQPAGRMRTMTVVVSEAVSRQRFTMFLAGVFASWRSCCRSSASTLWCRFRSPNERTRSGLRYALGATPGSLVALVLSEGMRLVAVGVVFGLAGGVRARAFPRDAALRRHRPRPGTFIVVALLLLAAAIVGCLIPARRATRIDPMTALRTQ